MRWPAWLTHKGKDGKDVENVAAIPALEDSLHSGAGEISTIVGNGFPDIKMDFHIGHDG